MNTETSAEVLLPGVQSVFCHCHKDRELTGPTEIPLRVTDLQGHHPYTASHIGPEQTLRKSYQDDPPEQRKSSD